MQNETSGSEMFEVEKIIGKQKFGKVWKYKVKWVDFPESKSTWEPEDNLGYVRPLINAYEQSLKKGKEPRNKRNNSEKQDEESKEEDSQSSQHEKKVKERDSKSFLGTKRQKSPKKSDSESKEIKQKQESESEEEEEEKSQMKRSLRARNKKQKIEKSPSPKKDPPVKEKPIEKEKLITEKKEIKGIKGIKEQKEKEKEKEKLNDSISKSSMVSSVQKNTQGQPEETREGELSKDIPMKIVTAKQHNSEDDLILCEVEWLPNIKGFKPLNSCYTNHELKKNYASILCDFYETRLAFPKSKKIK